MKTNSNKLKEIISDKDVITFKPKAEWFTKENIDEVPYWELWKEKVLKDFEYLYNQIHENFIGIIHENTKLVKKRSDEEKEAFKSLFELVKLSDVMQFYLNQDQVRVGYFDRIFKILHNSTQDDISIPYNEMVVLVATLQAFSTEGCIHNPISRLRKEVIGELFKDLLAKSIRECQTNDHDDDSDELLKMLRESTQTCGTIENERNSFDSFIMLYFSETIEDFYKNIN